MGFLSLYEGTEDVPIRDDYVVVIKKHLTSEDYDEAKKALTRFDVSDPTESSGETRSKVKPDPNIPEYQRELVVAAIVSWNLTDTQNNVLPLVPVEAKRASVKILPESVVQKIYLCVQANDKDDPKAAAQFHVGADGGDQVGDGRPNDPAAVQPGAGVLEAVRTDAGQVEVEATS